MKVVVQPQKWSSAVESGFILLSKPHRHTNIKLLRQLVICPNHLIAKEYANHKWTIY